MVKFEAGSKVKFLKGDAVKFLRADACSGAGVEAGDVGNVIEVCESYYRVLVGERQYQNIRCIGFERADQILELCTL